VDNIISRLEESKKITPDTQEKQRLQYTDAFRRSSDIIQQRITDTISQKD